MISARSLCCAPGSCVRSQRWERTSCSSWKWNPSPSCVSGPARGPGTDEEDSSVAPAVAEAGSTAVPLEEFTGRSLLQALASPRTFHSISCGRREQLPGPLCPEPSTTRDSEKGWWQSVDQSRRMSEMSLWATAGKQGPR